MNAAPEIKSAPMSTFHSIDWKNVFYYPGAGIDVQPLLRFTHLTDTFFYVNLYLKKEDIIEGIIKSVAKYDVQIGRAHV